MEELLTVGHSNHEERAFLDLLDGAGIDLIADVRVSPRSRYPQFTRPALAASLEGAGIAYSHFAELGGRREPAPDTVNLGWDEEGFRGYADHMASDEFAAGLDRLERLGRTGRVAVMCAEADWTQCHRQLVADALSVRGWRVLHLGRDSSRIEHELTDFAVVDGTTITYPEPQTSLDV